MKRLINFFTAVILAVYLSPMTAWSAETFVQGFEDLPLMQGLSQVVGNSVLFDTPQGRIVQASATGAMSQADVLKFYTETLPQLGWTRVAEGEFQREGEMLKLEFNNASPDVEVRFLVEPISNR